MLFGQHLEFNRRSLLARSIAATATFIFGDLVSKSSSAASFKSADATSTDVTSADTKGVPTFPLNISPDKHCRYLEDSAGKPFLVHGEAAWSLIAQLSREQADQYLDDRSARGFNALLVSLIEHKFADNAPTNRYGEPPFLTGGDYNTPNERYFAHADWVLRRASEKGFLVLLTPSYLGYRGGPEGWYHEMVANGPEKLRQYGEYLGRRYRGFNNILWVEAGDYNPPNKTLVRAVAEGIRKFDHGALQTAHCAPGTAALDYWRGEPWLDINSIYTNTDSVYAAALKQYIRPNPLPFILLESAYENEFAASEQQLRMQSYQALLAGAAGQIFGNNPIWHFDGPGLYPAPVTWQQAMNSRGTQSMTHLRNLFSAVSWWLLVPDFDNAILTPGFFLPRDRAVAARSVDRSFAIFYLPSPRTLVIDLSQLAGPRIVARWYDPANGQYSQISGSPFAAAGAKKFTALTRNNSGFGDWVLVLESHN